MDLNIDTPSSHRSSTSFDEKNGTSNLRTPNNHNDTNTQIVGDSVISNETDTSYLTGDHGSTALEASEHNNQQNLSSIDEPKENCTEFLNLSGNSLMDGSALPFSDMDDDEEYIRVSKKSNRIDSQKISIDFDNSVGFFHYFKNFLNRGKIYPLSEMEKQAKMCYAKLSEPTKYKYRRTPAASASKYSRKSRKSGEEPTLTINCDIKDSNQSEDMEEAEFEVKQFPEDGKNFDISHIKDLEVFNFNLDMDDWLQTKENKKIHKDHHHQLKPWIHHPRRGNHKRIYENFQQYPFNWPQNPPQNKKNMNRNLNLRPIDYLQPEDNEYNSMDQRIRTRRTSRYSEAFENFLDEFSLLNSFRSKQILLTMAKREFTKLEKSEKQRYKSNKTSVSCNWNIISIPRTIKKSKKSRLGRNGREFK